MGQEQRKTHARVRATDVTIADGVLTAVLVGPGVEANRAASSCHRLFSIASTAADLARFISQRPGVPGGAATEAAVSRGSNLRRKERPS